MKLPPALMKLHILNRSRRIRLWLPLFLVWLLLALIALLLIPFILAGVVIALCSERGREWLRGGSALYCCVCSLRGLKLDIEQKNEKIEIAMH